MSRTQQWICLLAALAFLAGAAVSALFSATFQRQNPLSGPFADYEKHFASAFDPSEKQLRLLRKILLAYQKDEENVKNRYVPVMEPELSDAGRRAESRLVNILTPEQKTRYEQLLRQGEELFPAAEKRR